MKITILLCALASIAAAVPTNLHENLQEHESAVDHLTDTTLRERKSPLHDHHADAEAETTSSSGHKSSTMEGRHFKKPIIVKKKIGYHVYRDSDEEMAHADPHENCREQVKVKLCDDEPGSPKSIGSCLTSDVLNEEKEIENSIKTAKEAVENLQRGFHKMEHHTGKLGNTEDKEFEEHVAVHQHIEAARKALEQVQQNFEHLDTLHSKPSEEEKLAQWKEAMDNIQKNFEIARNIEDDFKTESEQTNLQSLPPLQQLDEPVKVRESEHTESKVDFEKNKDELISNQSNGLQKQRDSDVDMYAAPTEQKELEIKLHSDSLKTEKISDESVVDHETKAKNIEKTMDHVPTMKNSEITPMIGESMKTGDMSAKLQETTDKVHQHELKAASDIDMGKENLKSLESNTQDKTFKMEKSSVLEVEDMKPFIKDKSNDDQLNLVKSAQEESLGQTTKHHDMSVGSSNIVNHQSHLGMKHTLNNEDDKLTNKENTIVTKTSTSEGQMFDHSMKSKAVQNMAEHHKHVERMNRPLQGKEDNMPAQMQINAINNMRSSQQSHIESIPTTGFNNGQQTMNTHPLMRTIEGQNMAHLEETPDFHNLNDHSVMQMAEDQDKLHAFLMRWAHENQQLIPESPLSEDLMRSTKMGELNNGQHIHNEQMGMRSSQDLNTGHQISENNEHDRLFTQWAQDNQHQTMRNPVTDGRNLDELFMTRFAEEKQQQDHLKTAPEFHNGHSHEGLAQNKFAMANTQDLSQLGPRMHEHLHIMKHAMPSDMDSAMQPSMHMSMRDAMGKPRFEHNDMHWNHHHHAMARYGSGSGLPISGVGGGAVGLFPNANTGSCGIPLMLSCSPSVVSGTLAKAQTHPTAITAPAYRSGDDLMYYMKRDAKDSEDLPALKIQKSSIPFTHKPELIYDKSR